MNYLDISAENAINNDTVTSSGKWRMALLSMNENAVQELWML